MIDNNAFKKMRLTPLFALLVVMMAWALPGCGYSDGDFFWVSRNNAEMPVWVRGNTDSGVFVILNHGGPGSSGLFEVYMEAAPGNGEVDHVSPLRQLEEDYAVVYWDQRHSGNAQGNADPDETTWEDFGADLELVIDTLNSRHDVESVFVIGQSWGHAVGTIYLTLGDDWQRRQDKVDGYIIYKGNITANMPYEFAAPRGLELAQEQIDSGDDSAMWQDCAVLWRDTESLSVAQDYMEHQMCVDHAMDAVVSTGQRILTSLAFSFRSAHNGWYHSANNSATLGSTFMDRVVTEEPLLETAHRIELPTLLLYGALDLTAPSEVGQWHYDTIGTPAADKKLVILEQSRHGAEGNDIEVLQQELSEFIETYL